MGLDRAAGPLSSGHGVDFLPILIRVLDGQKSSTLFHIKDAGTCDYADHEKRNLAEMR